MQKYLVFLLIFICLPLYSVAKQLDSIKYYDVDKFQIIGKSTLSDSLKFYRIKETLVKDFPEKVKELAKNTSGFNVVFQTNSTSLSLKWQLREYKTFANMTPIAINGFDLYGWNENKWQFVAAAKPSSINNEVAIVKNLDGRMHHFRLYFPLYTGVKKVKIGIDADKKIERINKSFLPHKKIVIYGSSITQGASASRPGMTFSAIIGRNLNADVYNFGFSGAGKMEIEVALVLSKLKPDLFILDCVPNASMEQINTRTMPFIEALRKDNPNIPVLMVESLFREDGHWDIEKGKKVLGQNQAFKNIYLKLKELNDVNLFYLNHHNLIGKDNEATIDGTHFNDIGHMRMADNLIESVHNILK
ncbi:SGNH/GDSL hydrolase family protein [Gelidibacter salicanalis]|uniref:SGNH/GDSL hydrolase family protein n=1 Tax=Gelidibacter salicanalis TaxID=291193 RepID=A0A934NJF6_9FLAO|nr:SGNH/GDSL hydrolase family protein [Gelidibacter salicanalis]MBJ7882478.1 SGNH/GDSL hydrolase family protein [Gelidibacter salicanalis]